MMAKVDKARSDRNNEVIRTNKWRENYDDMLKTREEKGSAGSRIRERQRRAAEVKSSIELSFRREAEEDAQLRVMRRNRGKNHKPLVENPEGKSN
ncbi:unnamed protein product [Caenorhabditis nigoni]